MNLTKLIVLALASLLSAPTIIAQCNVRATEKADYAYKSNAFFNAVGFYKKAKRKVGKDKAAKACVQYQMAKCYIKLGEYKKAESQLKGLIDKGDIDPVLYLEYADLLKSQGKYDEAKTQYQTYKEKNPADPRGEIGVKSCELSVQWMNNPTCYQVENMKAWNTKEMDYAASYSSKKYTQVIFTSNRPKSYGKATAIMDMLSEDLYEVTKDRTGKWGTPTTLGDPVNSDKSEGAAIMDGKYRVLYFTRCFSDKKNGSFCQIFKTQRQGVKWTEPEKLAFVLDSFVTGHPTITADGRMMIFSSNMPGGEGGMDLWYATYNKKKKDFENPTNLGKAINTPFNELYPFLREDGTLYFSSTKPEGMGGMDIYKAPSTGENTWGNPENMKYPINSEGDDFGIHFEPGKEGGFISSNRKGGKGMDDIYEFSVPTAKIILSGTVRDKDTRAVLPDATVEMKDLAGNVVTAKSDQTGFYKLEIPFGVSYDMTATKKDYYNDVNRASTMGLDPMINCKDTNIIADFELKTTKVNIEFEIQFVFTKDYPEDAYLDTVKNLLIILQDNPTLKVEIGAHTDSRGDVKSNQALSERRAKWVVDYLIKAGIPKERLLPKGYGEEKPRVLAKDMKGLLTSRNFPKGTEMTDDYINGLKSESNDAFEDGHRLNRRIEMKILSDDYKPVKPKEDEEEKEED